MIVLLLLGLEGEVSLLFFWDYLSSSLIRYDSR